MSSSAVTGEGARTALVLAGLVLCNGTCPSWPLLNSVDIESLSNYCTDE